MINPSLMNKMLGSLWPQAKKLKLEKWMYACPIDVLTLAYQNYHCSNNKKIYLIYWSFMLVKSKAEAADVISLTDDKRREIVSQITLTNALNEWPEDEEFTEEFANQIVYTEDQYKNYSKLKKHRRGLCLLFNLISIGTLGRATQLFLDQNYTWFVRAFELDEEQFKFDPEVICEAYTEIWQCQNCFQFLQTWFASEKYVAWNKPMKLFIVRCMYQSQMHLNAIEIGRSISSDSLIWKSSFIEGESSRVIHALHHRKRFPMCSYRGAPGHDKLHLTNPNLIRTTAYCSGVILNSVGLANSLKDQIEYKWFVGEGVAMKDQLEVMLVEWGHRFVENPDRKTHIVQVAKQTKRCLIGLCLEYQIEQMPTFTDLKNFNANVVRKLTESEIDDFLNEFTSAFGDSLF